MTRRAQRKTPEPAREAPAREVTFAITATVIDSGLFLRQAIADGDATIPGIGKVTVEIAASVSGPILVTVKPKNRKGWRTYALSCESLIREAIDKYIADPLPKWEK